MEENKLPSPSAPVLSPRELVEKTFVDFGFPNENPDDLDAITELLEIWRNPNIDDTDPDFEYTQEQYILLNDPDVVRVLNACKEYYEPKRRLSKTQMITILEQIASGKLTRQDYDFKNGEPITMEPTFAERLTAIKMLREEANDNSSQQATVQFVNNIINPSATPDFTPPNMDAPEAPPANHYSLNLTEENLLKDGED